MEAASGGLTPGYSRVTDFFCSCVTVCADSSVPIKVSGTLQVQIQLVQMLSVTVSVTVSD